MLLSKGFVSSVYSTALPVPGTEIGLLQPSRSTPQREGGVGTVERASSSKGLRLQVCGVPHLVTLCTYIPSRIIRPPPVDASLPHLLHNSLSYLPSRGAFKLTNQTKIQLPIMRVFFYSTFHTGYACIIGCEHHR